jgi:hypothetical protein
MKTMGILDQLEGTDPPDAVRCPLCGAGNTALGHCKHVRWTFDQGDALDFTNFALETSPYTANRGFRTRDIPKIWWEEHADWLIGQIELRFGVSEGFVFGEIAELDLLARDVWNQFKPDPARPAIVRH